MHRPGTETRDLSITSPTPYHYTNRATMVLTRLEQQRFTISEVAADWHELMIPWRIMRPSIARDGEQLDPRCSTQTYHRPNQRNVLF